MKSIKKMPKFLGDSTKEPMIQTRFQRKATLCGICLSAIEEQGEMDSCTHEFCFKCINTWAARENTCPYCKTRFSGISRKWRRPNYEEKKKRKHQLAKKPDTPPTSDKVEVPFRNQSSVAETAYSIVFSDILSMFLNSFRPFERETEDFAAVEIQVFQNLLNLDDLESVVHE